MRRASSTLNSALSVEQVCSLPSQHETDVLSWAACGSLPRTLPADSGGASRFFYCPKSSSRERYFYCRTCAAVCSRRDIRMHQKHDLFQHPTQKPLALMEYLVRMVTPPGGTVLDPFCGTGTTGVAARTQGFGFVGIDLDPDTIRIATYRTVNDPEPLPSPVESEPSTEPPAEPSAEPSKKTLTLFSLGRSKGKASTAR